LKYIFLLLHSDLFKKLIAMKTNLIRLDIIRKYINIFFKQSELFVKEKKFIVNMSGYININVLNAMDVQFFNFINNIENWWHHWCTVSDDYSCLS